MMGALENEMPHLIFYPFCFPVNNGTIAAMETFFSNNVSSALSFSEYSNIPLKNSPAAIFNQSGYETSYFTGGYNGWRNVGNYCRTQGFNNVCGAEYMKTLFPHAEKTEWGVFDQYLFDAIFDKLQNSDSQPQFMVCMTITNHSPHKIPKNYQLYSLQFPEGLSSRTTKDMQQTISTMQTFQYANDCLGKFLHRLRNSSLGENTIVVVTGDHAMTGGFSYADRELLYSWGVPLAFYIPKKYAEQLHRDTTRLVSHKDILPTIYNLAFSNYTYRATGDNIFDAKNAENPFLITQSYWIVGKAGCTVLHSHNSFTWQENSFYLQPAEYNKELESLRKKANAWLFGMKWQIYAELK
jgi:phosphoglycerol transferase MdoB-like AlkP superfamily enzyme